MHPGLAYLADLLHLRDHGVRIEDVIGVSPDWWGNVRTRLLFLVLGVREEEEVCTKRENPFLGRRS